jgi:hypothetical protein
VLYATMRHNYALDRVNESRAILSALAASFGKENAASATFAKAERVEAFLEAGS